MIHVTSKVTYRGTIFVDDCEWLKGVGVMEEFDVNVIVIPDCRFS
jgi:hypothetical protein